MKQARGGAGRSRPPGKRGEHVSVRVDHKTKVDLERAAARRKWTVSSEAADRLRRTFAEDAALEQMFDRPTRSLIVLVGRIVQSVSLATGKSWRDDAYTYLEVSAGIELLLAELPAVLSGSRAREEPEVPERVREMYPDSGPARGEIGRRMARGMLDLLLYGERPSDRDAVALSEFTRIHHDLGIGRKR